MLDPEVLASAQADIVRSQQRDPVARRLEPLRRVPTRVLQQPDDADHGRGENRLPTRFIVEGNVAAHHRQLERATRLRDSLDGLFELPEDLRTLRGAEVQAIRHAEWQGARARHVAGRLAHGHGRAAARIEDHVPPIAVRRHGESAARSLHAQDGGVGARGDESVDADLLVVLAVRPLLARDRRRGQQGHQDRCHIERRREPAGIERASLGELGRLLPRLVVARTLREGIDRQARDLLPLVADDELTVRDHGADADGVELPLREDPAHLVFAAAHGHEQHALLRLGEQELVRRHALFALRHRR